MNLEERLKELNFNQQMINLMIHGERHIKDFDTERVLVMAEALRQKGCDNHLAIHHLAEALQYESAGNKTIYLTSALIETITQSNRTAKRYLEHATRATEILKELESIEAYKD